MTAVLTAGLEETLDLAWKVISDEACPTKVREVIDQLKAVGSTVPSEKVRLWQTRLSDLERRLADINDPWNLHATNCTRCHASGHSARASDD